jgi:two-component system, chemotaxis family, chemotaxis protein CheY
VSRTRAKTILVVEDDPELRHSTGEFLRRSGYYVVAAADGVQGLELLRQSGAITLILLDLLMPRMNGFEFRERQMQDPTLAQIPVIVVTAHGQLAERAGALGAVPVLRKPLDFDELVRLIEQLT